MDCSNIEVSEDYVATANGWEMDLSDSVATCDCGNQTEPDAHNCPECGSLNPFVFCGTI